MYRVRCTTGAGIFIEGEIDEDDSSELLPSMHNVTHLDISNTNIEHVPNTMTRLHSLYASSSSLKSIPSTLYLRELDIRNTHVESQKLPNHLEYQLRLFNGDIKRDEFFLL